MSERLYLIAHVRYKSAIDKFIADMRAGVVERPQLSDEYEAVMGYEIARQVAAGHIQIIYSEPIPEGVTR